MRFLYRLFSFKRDTKNKFTVYLDIPSEIIEALIGESRN